MKIYNDFQKIKWQELQSRSKAKASIFQHF